MSRDMSWQPFDAELQFSKPTIAVIIAKRGSGASTLCLDLLQQVSPVGSDHLSEVTVFHRSEEFVQFYRPHVSIQGQVFSELDPKHLTEVYEERMHWKQQLEEESDVDKLVAQMLLPNSRLGFDLAKLTRDYNVISRKPLVLVLDGVLPGLSRDAATDLLTPLFCNGRHWNLTTLITLQSISQLSPMLRSRSDLVFLGPCSSLKAKKEVFKRLVGGRIQEENTFCQIWSDWDGSTYGNTHCGHFLAVETRDPAAGVRWYDTTTARLNDRAPYTLADI